MGMSFVSGTSSNGCTGAIFLHSGSATNGKAGSINIMAGDGDIGNGGAVVISGGKSRLGADVTISGGESSSSTGGHLYVTGGSGTGSTGGTGGNIIFKGAELWLQRSPSQSSNLDAMYLSGTLYMKKAIEISGAFRANSWKFSSSKSITQINSGVTYIDGNTYKINSNARRDFDFTATGVNLGDLIIMNPAADAVAGDSTQGIFWKAWVRSANSISLRIKNFGSSQWNKAGNWRWMAIRAQ